MQKRFLKNHFLEVQYLEDSLRIIGLTPAGKTNILAELSSMPPIKTPYGDFHFRGGHRLWHAPEAMPRTYIPDPGNVTITEFENGVILDSPTEPGSGIRKRIRVQLAPDKPSVRLTHTLINDGLWTVELSPWAITQFRLGGTAILPMPVGNVDLAGLLPNRQFALWPYARINDPRLRLGDRYILFKAEPLLPPFKFGYFNQNGWMAYQLDGVLFRKTFEVRTGRLHPDGNCNSELYCNDQFVELETLAPLTTLPPQASVELTEIWELSAGTDALPVEIQRELVFR